MPLLAPLVEGAKAARAAVATRGYAGPDWLGCMDIAAHPNTSGRPPGTTIARIRLTRPLLAADRSPCAFTDWLHGDLGGNPDVPILQVRLHAHTMDDVIQASTGRANPAVNKTQRRHMGTEGTTLLFAAHKPTTTKARKDKYPFKHPLLDTLRYVVDNKPAMFLPNYSLTSHSPYCLKPELLGLTMPLLMKSEDAVLPLAMCHALPLIGTSEPVMQVDIFREVNEELLELGQTGHVFKQEFLVKDGDMLTNMKIKADNLGQRSGGKLALQSQNRPPDPGDKAAVYAVIPMGNGGQEGLHLPHVVLWAERVPPGLSTKYPGLFLVTVGYVRATSDQPHLWHRDLPLELQTVGVEHAFSCFMPANLDCPMDRRENMLVYGSGSGVPYPLQEVSMSMLAGDLWILSSYVIHRGGGAITRDAPAGSTRSIVLATTATGRNYKTTVPIIPPPWVEAPAQQPSPPSPKAVHCTEAECNRVVKADPPVKCFACDKRPLCAVHVRQLCADCHRNSEEDALAVEAVPPAMAAEGAQEVDEGTREIVEEDPCGFAAVVMMPLDQTVLYTTHRLGPLAAGISAGPLIDVSAQPCALEECPLGPFVHEDEELKAPTPSKSPVIRMQPDSLMMVREGQVGGMAVVEDTVNPLVAKVLRWDVAGTHPRVIDTSVLVQLGLLVANRAHPK